ncbi:Spy/CpxP family protein refolding chaperone [uncultured Sutterella sp.]|mgnify:CR=1 FL=1|uniref:Spy/CpxP family protein refolding chaperone n=1 Tax=uncultured Sutterella sp. TaxID=286133 RepID=UPI0025D690E2|nr:Spy/CpxP family protein refolding chaperone [uncultured Sutterella sp.]
MKKSHKIIASLTALGALCVAGAAVAAPWHHGEDVPRGDAPCAGYSAEDVRAAGWASMERILTLKPEQQAAWKAYVEARTALDQMPGAKFDKPAVDVQTRLERRAQVAKIRADLLGKTAAARAELFKALSPEQKYVLESYELMHSGHGMRGGDKPRVSQGFHGPHNPQCPAGGECPAR